MLSLPPIELLQCYLYLLPLTTTETFIDITAIDHITRHLTHTTPTHADLYIDILTTLHANCRPQVVQNLPPSRSRPRSHSQHIGLHVLIKTSTFLRHFTPTAAHNLSMSSPPSTSRLRILLLIQQAKKASFFSCLL